MTMMVLRIGATFALVMALFGIGMLSIAADVAPRPVVVAAPLP